MMNDVMLEVDYMGWCNGWTAREMLQDHEPIEKIKYPKRTY